MFISCMNDVEREGKERFDPWAPVASNIAGMFRLRRMEKVVFWMPGTAMLHIHVYEPGGFTCRAKLT